MTSHAILNFRGDFYFQTWWLRFVIKLVEIKLLGLGWQERWIALASWHFLEHCSSDLSRQTKSSCVIYFVSCFRSLRQKGADDQMPPIRKKQRGLLLRLQLEQAEIKRLKGVQKAAEQERQMLLQQQEDIYKLHRTTKQIMDRMKFAALGGQFIITPIHHKCILILKIKFPDFGHLCIFLFPSSNASRRKSFQVLVPAVVGFLCPNEPFQPFQIRQDNGVKFNHASVVVACFHHRNWGRHFRHCTYLFVL